MSYFDYFYFTIYISQYKSLDKQYDAVKDKFWRRIRRFLNNIKEPTLFVRYISSEELNNDGRSIELNWIEHNYEYILNILKRYNSDNEILFIGDENIISNVIKVYQVNQDIGDHVSRAPICNNKELYPILSTMKFPGKEENQRRYNAKERKKRSIIRRLKNKTTSFIKKKFIKEYVHNKVYNIPGK